MTVAPLLLLHGFTGGPHSFELVLQELTAMPAVIAPWLVGHGEPAAAPEIASFEAEVDRLAALLPTEQRALLVGYSLGARLGLALAVRHPQRLRAAVLISGRDGLSTETERAARRRHDARFISQLERDGVARFVDDWERQPLFASQRELPVAVRERQRAQRLAHSARGLSHSLRVTGLAEMPSYAERLEQLNLPLEFLAGERDAAFCQHASAVVGKLPRGKLTRVPEASHNLLLERPIEVARAIERGFRT